METPQGQPPSPDGYTWVSSGRGWLWSKCWPNLPQEYQQQEHKSPSTDFFLAANPSIKPAFEGVGTHYLCPSGKGDLLAGLWSDMVTELGTNRQVCWLLHVQPSLGQEKVLPPYTIKMSSPEALFHWHSCPESQWKGSWIPSVRFYVVLTVTMIIFIFWIHSKNILHLPFYYGYEQLF